MNQHIRKIAGIGAVLAGITALLYSLALYGLGENPFGRYKYMIAVVYALFFAGSMWYYRDRLNNYHMGAKEGIVLGLLLNAFASTLYVGLLFVVLRFTEAGEGIIAIHQQQSLEILDQAREYEPEKMTADLYQQTKEIILKWDAFELAADQIAFFLGVGFFNTIVFSLIISFGGLPAAEQK